VLVGSGFQADGTLRNIREVASIWVDSLGPNFQTALDLMEAAIQDCTDELWQANMWEVPTDAAEVRGPNGDLITDPAKRRALVQRYGQPWYVAWHGLEVLDANLNGGFTPWKPWPPFGGKGIVDTMALSGPWSRADLVGYTEYCRQRVVDTLAEVTDERAATVIGRRGQPYAARLIDKLGHVIEHGSQIRQFITAAGVAPPTREKVGPDVRIRSSRA
jgi:hypothetical protein